MSRRHRHLDGTEHEAATVRRVVRVPRPAPKPWIDARVLLVSALIASPAAFRSSQGLLSTSAALDRFLVIAVGCVGVSVLIRAIWPVVVGEPESSTRTVAGVEMPSATADAVDEDLLNDVFATASTTDAFDGPADLTGLPGLTDLALPPGSPTAPPAHTGQLDLLEDDVDAAALLQ